jgi:hypothetical protein
MAIQVSNDIDALLKSSDNAIILDNVTVGTWNGTPIADGKIASAATWNAHGANTSNPHSVTKAQVGLANAENTAISTWTGSANIVSLGNVTSGTWNGTAIADGKIASAAAWNAKQAALVSGTNIKTVNGTSVLGSGDIVVAGTAVTPVDLGATTALVPNSAYYHAALTSRIFTFISSLTNGQSIRIDFVCGTEIVLQFPTSSRMGDSGTTTSITFPIGNHVIKWEKSGTIQKVIDSAWEDTGTSGDVTAPTILSLSPVNNYALVGTTDNFFATFSESILMEDSGVILITNITDATTHATINIPDPQASVSGAVLTINPTSNLIAGKNYAIQISEDCIKDAAGNFFAGITDNATWNFSTAVPIDTTPPTISTATISANGTTLTLVFSEAVSVGSGGSGGFNLDAATTGANLSCTYVSGTGTNTLVYTIGSTVVNGEVCDLDYVQPGNGIEDIAGVDLASITSRAVTNNSTQGADSTPPAISSLSPANGGSSIAIGSNLVATFTEALGAAGTGNVTIKDLSNTPAGDVVIPIGNAQCVISGSTLTINPTADLVAGKTYAIQIAATCIDDANGNSFAGITDDSTWSFATAASGVTYITQEDFTGTGAPTNWTSGGTPNYDATDADFGSCLACLGATNTAADQRAKYNPPSSATTATELYVKLKITDLTNTDQPLVVMVNGATALATVHIYSNGKITVKNAGGTESSQTVGTMAVNTVYHLWMRHQKSSGANDAFVSVGFSTDTTRPTSGDNYVSSNNGTNTGVPNQFDLRGDGSGSTANSNDVYFDSFKLAYDQTIPSNP